MKKLSGIAIFLFLVSPAWALEFTGVNISSCASATVTVSSSTASILPARRIRRMSSVSYANQSSSDTVFFVPMSSVTIALSGFPLQAGDKISIDLSPLRPFATFYFLSRDGSSGAEVRVLSCGEDGGFD